MKISNVRQFLCALIVCGFAATTLLMAGCAASDADADADGSTLGDSAATSSMPAADSDSDGETIQDVDADQQTDGGRGAGISDGRTGGRGGDRRGGAMPGGRGTPPQEPRSAPQPAADDSLEIEGGLNNGLYPQTNPAFSRTGFGGGLVPNFTVPPHPPGVAANGGGSDRRGPRPGQPASAGGFDSEFENDVDSATPAGTMLDFANLAFANGDEKSAIRFLHGHMLTDATAIDDYEIQWYPGISQPRAAFRWGIGIQYRPARTFEGNPPVIGDPVSVNIVSGPTGPGATTTGGRGGGISSGGRGGISSRRGGGTSNGGRGGGSIGGARGGNSGGGAGGDSAYKNLDTSTPVGMLLYYTGELGERTLDALESRRLDDEAYYGKLLQAVDTGEDRSVDLLSRVSGTSIAAVPDDDLMGTLVPGVMLLGAGAQDDLIERGRKLGIDGIIIFTVRVSSANPPVNSTTMKLINLHPREGQDEGVENANVKHSDVARKRDNGSNSDPIESALRNIFVDAADLGFKADEMPELKPEHARGRVVSLLASQFEDPLPIAVEIVTFHRKSLIDDAFATSSLDQLFGEGVAAKLLSIDADDRIGVLDKFLPDLPEIPVVEEEAPSGRGGINGGGRDTGRAGMFDR